MDFAIGRLMLVALRIERLDVVEQGFGTRTRSLLLRSSGVMRRGEAQGLQLQSRA